MLIHMISNEGVSMNKPIPPLRAKHHIRNTMNDESLLKNFTIAQLESEIRSRREYIRGE